MMSVTSTTIITTTTATSSLLHTNNIDVNNTNIKNLFMFTPILISSQKTPTILKKSIQFKPSYDFQLFSLDNLDS